MDYLFLTLLLAPLIPLCIIFVIDKKQYDDHNPQHNDHP
jgi:hypothetical protein